MHTITYRLNTNHLTRNVLKNKPFTAIHPILSLYSQLKFRTNLNSSLF